MTRYAVPALKKAPAVSKGDFDTLIKSGHFIRWANASLTVSGDRFVMTGPSGTHSLAVGYTDRTRLNAHWKTFALHGANQRVAA